MISITILSGCSATIAYENKLPKYTIIDVIELSPILTLTVHDISAMGIVYFIESSMPYTTISVPLSFSLYKLVDGSWHHANEVIDGTQYIFPMVVAIRENFFLNYNIWFLQGYSSELRDEIFEYRKLPFGIFKELPPGEYKYSVQISTSVCNYSYICINYNAEYIFTYIFTIPTNEP